MSRLLYGPQEGWLSLLLLIAVVLSPALSLADAGWVDDLWIVPWFALLSVLLGTALAKLQLRWAVAHLFSAEVGLVLVAFYFAGKQAGGSWEERFVLLWGRVQAWLELALGGGMSNDSMLFALLMALAAWLIGYLSAWFLFRMHNVWPSLAACGLALLINLSYVVTSPLLHFLLFLFAALLLLIRITLFEKESEWSRVDAEYNRGLAGSFLWRGAALSVVILALAWAVPVGSANASVADGWHQITGPWQGLQGEFDRLFASVGFSTGKVEGSRFAKTLGLKGAIELGSELVMVVSSPRPEYWSAQAYNKYTGQGWMSTADSSTRLDANDQRLTETSLYRGRQDIEQRFKLVAGRSTTIFAATAPVKLSLPAYADHFGSLDDLAALRSIAPLRPGQQYAVISSVSVASADELRKAGSDYPEWARSYLDLPIRSTRRVVALARRLTRDSSNSYDAAVTLQEYLRGFHYEVKVPPPPPDRDAVDWFLFTSKEGYCDYFASAMALMARAIGIPSRVVSGYNSGSYNEQTGLYEVRQDNAHSWPELFFPGYGWVRFEPTPSQPVPPRPETAPEQASTATEQTDDGLEALSFDVTSRDKLLLDDELDPGGGSLTSEEVVQRTVEWSRLWLPVGLLAGLLIFVVALRLLLSRQPPAARVYAQLCWMAGLLGWQSRPSYTAVEYGRLLCQASPELRSELETVVNCYVEETYGGREPAAAAAAEESWRRIRALLPLRLLRRRLSRQRFQSGTKE